MPKISRLPAAAATQLTDLIAAVQGNVTKKETLQQVMNLFSGSIVITEAQVTGLIADLASKLALAGGTMSGNINMGTHAITNMSDPINPQDAATKAYVDAAVGGAVTPAALTRVNDTNVTMTLGGTPATALLQAVSLTLGWSGELSLARGGTNANLIAANGAIPYSTASAIALLAPGTSGQLLQSGGAGAPNWTTATYPSASGASGNVLRSNGTNWVSSADSPGALTQNYIYVGDASNVAQGVAMSGDATIVASGALTILSATNPRITTGFKDSNNNQILTLAPGSASAVNYINVSNQATGLPPNIGALGADTDITLVLNGKGTGGCSIDGVDAATNAASGYVGELISNVVSSGSAVSLTNNNPANVTSISLTAGDWDVWGNVTCPSNTGSTTYLTCSVNNSSATLGDPSVFAQTHAMGTNANFGQCAPPRRFSLGSTTTIYLVAQAGFTAALTVCGGIYARRRR